MAQKSMEYHLESLYMNPMEYHNIVTVQINLFIQCSNFINVVHLVVLILRVKRNGIWILFSAPGLLDEGLWDTLDQK